MSAPLTTMDSKASPVRARYVQALVAALVLAIGILSYNNYLLRDTLHLSEGWDLSLARDKCARMPPSALATRYLGELHGVEIGASTQNSFGLARAMNVDFQDKPDEYWQQKGCPGAVVHIVAFGDDLPFKDGALDYVLSSHVIEHFFDPVKALREWHRVVKPGGFVFIIAPHKDRTFDKHSDATPVGELMDRASGKFKLSDYAKPTSKQALVKFGKESLGEYQQVMPHLLAPRKGGAPLGKDWAYFETDDHHHWSFWRTNDFVELARHLRMNVVEVQDVDDKVGNGFTIVIRK